MSWCGGCAGHLFPLTGNVPARLGGVQASSLLMQRLTFKMHRQFLAYRTHGMQALCGAHVDPIMDRRAYKSQLLYPISSTAKYDGKCCQPFGRTHGSVRERQGVSDQGRDRLELPALQEEELLSHVLTCLHVHEPRPCAALVRRYVAGGCRAARGLRAADGRGQKDAAHADRCGHRSGAQVHCSIAAEGTAAGRTSNPGADRPGRLGRADAGLRQGACRGK